MNAKFDKLSSLVLVDVLAALPMEHMLRMARLGHERLRHTASLKWVTDRMTDVAFGVVLKTYPVAAVFCTVSVLKKLQGRVVMPFSCENSTRTFDCLELVKKVPGRLQAFVELYCTNTDLSYECEHQTTVAALHELSKRAYLTISIKKGFSVRDIPRQITVLVFNYQYFPTPIRPFNLVLYRPARLHGRHVVDVLRAVCGSADVSEAELDRVRREATERANKVEVLDGVWLTHWSGAKVTIR